ncbi:MULTISPECIES: response regulator transcription factor [unclassified Nocardia]|uniref:response regulator transcription factor n=1 Tax=unclassified Nocardia TaxID=2637762 RepID=UPI0024A94F6E|nr:MULTISPECIES: response regulator transcription factor [unclassified Nocardia]
MDDALVAAWEGSDTQFRTRRRICVTEALRRRDRLAVLVIDDADIAAALALAVTGQEVELRVCADPAVALLALGRMCPDAVVLGPVRGLLGPIEFLDVVRRDEPDLPIVVGADAESGEFATEATGAGATAVVRRPYRAVELLTILGSLAGRPGALELRPVPIDLGRLRIDGIVPRMWLDGHEIALPPMEFTLLRYLAERPGAVVTRKELIRVLWGDRSAASNSLTVHIMRLRRRLGDYDRHPEWIRAVRRLGYQFEVPTRSSDVHTE